MKLDNGNGIEITLKTNNAVWHKSCRNKLDNQNLKRALKRKAKEEKEYEPSPVKTRTSSIGSMAIHQCFLCVEDDTDEINALTDKIDLRAENCWVNYLRLTCMP